MIYIRLLSQCSLWTVIYTFIFREWSKWHWKDSSKLGFYNPSGWQSWPWSNSECLCWRRNGGKMLFTCKFWDLCRRFGPQNVCLWNQTTCSYESISCRWIMLVSRKKNACPWLLRVWSPSILVLIVMPRSMSSVNTKVVTQLRATNVSFPSHIKMSLTTTALRKTSIYLGVPLVSFVIVN